MAVDVLALNKLEHEHLAYVLQTGTECAFHMYAVAPQRHPMIIPCKLSACPMLCGTFPQWPIYVLHMSYTCSTHVLHTPYTCPTHILYMSNTIHRLFFSGAVLIMFGVVYHRAVWQTLWYSVRNSWVSWI